MTTSIDPFTRATASYQQATRHPFKTGSAWEGYTPKRSGWPLVIVALTAMGAFFIAMAVTGNG